MSAVRRVIISAPALGPHPAPQRGCRVGDPAFRRELTLTPRLGFACPRLGAPPQRGCRAGGPGWPQALAPARNGETIRTLKILGIETSCDETAAAVVEETGDAEKPWAIRSNVIASQVAIHREWGGVVPELASRQHIRDICGVVERAFEPAKTRWDDLGAIAVTQGPGLVGSLLVGVAFAKAAAAASGLPLVAVHHLAGHIESLVLQNGEMPLPAVVLVVSGGHTSLYLVEQRGEDRLLSRPPADSARATASNR